MRRKPGVPDPSFVAEYASLSEDEFEKNIGKYFDRELSYQERAYLSEFEATVYNVRDHLSKVEKRYESRKKDLDKREKKDLTKVNSIADMEISTINQIYEGVKGTADRIIPTFASYITVKAIMDFGVIPREFEDLPAVVAGATLFLSHFILNKYGESAKAKILEKKEKKEERIEQKYKFLRSKLEMDKDKKKRQIISRAERKLKKVYKEYFGEEHLPTETSAEYFFRKEKVDSEYI